MKTCKRTPLWLIAPVLATALLLLALASADRDPAPRRAFHPAAEAPALDGPPPPAADQVDRAEAEVLTLRFASDRSLRVESLGHDALGASLPGMDVTFRMRAVLELRVYDAREWGLVLTRLEATATAQGRPAPAEVDLAESMAGEVIVRLDEYGRIVEVFCPQAMPAPGRQAWMHIADCLQCTLLPGEATYETAERDDTGVYLARYERFGPVDAMPARLKRTKVRYLEVATIGRGGLEPEAEIEGETRLTLDPLPIRLKGEHTLHVKLRATSQLATARVRYDIECVGRTRRALARPQVEALLGSDDVPEDEQAARAATERLHELVRAYAGLRAAGRQRSDEARDAFTDIVDVVRHSPAAVVAAEELFADAPGALAAALAAADTRESGAVLEHVLADRSRSLGERHAALMAASDLSRPSVALERTLRRVREQVPEFANSAQLALASIGDTVRADEPGRFAQIEAEVLADLKKARTVGELTTALEAVGNLGPRILPRRVRECLIDDSPIVRSAAAHALARIRLDEARGLLFQVVRHDHDAGARQAALNTLGIRRQLGIDAPRTLNGLLAEIAEEDADASVRRRARQLRSGE